MTAVAAALEAVTPLFIRHGWRVDEFRKEPLARLLRHMNRTAQHE
jgi:hypothetical protein